MADDADLARIRAFVAAGGAIETDAGGTPVVPLDESPAGSSAPQGQPTPGARSADAAASRREADRQADRQARLQRQAQADEARQRKAAGEKRSRSPLFRFSDALAKWAGNVPTPGGNLALVLLLLFFAFAIIPVNAGQTRLQLIWLVLTGNADLPGVAPANNGAPTGGLPLPPPQDPTPASGPSAPLPPLLGAAQPGRGVDITTLLEPTRGR